MEIFLYIVQVISDNRMWIMPAALFIIVVALGHEIYSVFRDMIEEMD